MNILLAVDGSEAGECAVSVLTEQFRPAGVHVRVLHAVEWLKELPLSLEFGQGPTYARNIVENQAGSFARAQALVARVEANLKQAGFQTTAAVEDADPRHAIVDAAAEWPADLIVMGSHGRRGLDRMLLGSVAESVMRHATCSVLIARVPQAQARNSRVAEACADSDPVSFDTSTAGALS